MLYVDEHQVFERDVCAAVPQRIVVGRLKLSLYTAAYLVALKQARRKIQYSPKTFELPEPRRSPICRASEPWSLSAGRVLDDDTEGSFRETVTIRILSICCLGMCMEFWRRGLTQSTMASFSATGMSSGHAGESASARSRYSLL